MAAPQDYHHFADDHHTRVRTKQFNAPAEVMPMVIEIATHKAKYTWDQLVILGMLSGVYVTFGSTLSLIVANGVPELKHSDPGLAKLLNGALFPIALILIIICGGELFTGNTMYFLVGLIDRKVTLLQLLRNWGIVYFANFAGAALSAFLFTYLTDLFEKEPWLSGVQSIIVVKTEKSFGVVFLKAVAANELVNLAIILTIVSEDIMSKIAGAWYAIMTFAVIGYEHCVANMFLCTVSLMYGGDRTVWEFLYRNLIPATLGNIFGGSIMVGALYYYSYVWRSSHHFIHHHHPHPELDLHVHATNPTPHHHDLPPGDFHLPRISSMPSKDSPHVPVELHQIHH